MNSLLHTIGWAIFAVGLLLAFLGYLWILILGWQRNVLWGVVCFFIPMLQLVYIAAHWKESKDGFFLQVAGVGLILLAIYIGVPVGY